jgi:hypothetical protein
MRNLLLPETVEQTEVTKEAFQMPRNSRQYSTTGRRIGVFARKQADR